MKWRCDICLLPCFLNVEDKEVISEPIRCPWNENAEWKLVEEPNSTGTSKPVDEWLELPRMVTENGLNSEHVMYNAAIEQIRQRIEKLEKAGGRDRKKYYLMSEIKRCRTTPCLRV